MTDAERAKWQTWANRAKLAALHVEAALRESKRPTNTTGAISDLDALRTEALTIARDQNAAEADQLEKAG